MAGYVTNGHNPPNIFLSAKMKTIFLITNIFLLKMQKSTKKSKKQTILTF